jgi:hypothetical protein
MHLFRVVAVCAALLPLLSTPAPAQFDGLLNRVPSSANALVLVNVEKVFDSSAAKEGGWKDKLIAVHKSGLTILPPQAKQAVLSAEFDLDMMTPIWQSALATWDKIPDSKTIAERTHGETDTILSLAAVQLPADAYVVRFDAKTIGFMSPANRQAVGRWVREVFNRETPLLSNYLAEAKEHSDRGTPIILALDLHDAVTVGGVRQKLNEVWEAYEFKDKADLEKTAKVLASVRGVTLGITLRNEPFGALKVDFDEEVAPIVPIAKELLLAVLHERGAFINEFEDWKFSASENQLRLDGHFTDSGLRRVFSVFDRPPSLEKQTPDEQLTEEQRTLKATKEYWESINDLYSDLRRKPKSQGNHYTVGSMGVWYDNYARKIDNLPILGVDPELVKFGAQMAATLRQASYAIKSGGVASGVAQRNAAPIYNTFSGSTTYGATYRSGWYGSGYVPYGNTYSVALRDVRAEQGQAARIRQDYRNTSIFTARTILDGLDVALADARRALTMKYQVEF